jgi:hypothetical protein
MRALIFGWTGETGKELVKVGLFNFMNHINSFYKQIKGSNLFAGATLAGRRNKGKCLKTD